MSRVKVEVVVQRPSGKVPVLVESATVELVQPGTTTRIPVYAAATGGSPLAQPFTTNAQGVVTQSMYIDSGQEYEKLATFTYTLPNGSVVTETGREYGVAISPSVETGLGSILSGGFGVTAATTVLGVAVADGGTSITQGPAPAVPFTPAMSGQRFWLARGGPLLVDGAGTTLDGADGAWEVSPLFGTFTYVSSTQGTLSVAAETAVTNGEIVIGADQTTAFNAAVAAGFGRIPRDTSIILDNAVIPSLCRVEGEDPATSRLVSTVQGGTPLVSVGVEPVARNFTILGNGYGAQPTNTTPTQGDVSDFIAKLAGSGCGIAYGHVIKGKIERVRTYHCGGDQVTTGRNGIAGIYLTMGCRYTTVESCDASYSRIGMCEDNYFGTADDANIGAPRWNRWVENTTNYNRIGWAIDGGGNSRGCEIRGHTANWNVIYGIETNRSRHVRGHACTTSYNGRGATGAPGLAIHGTSSVVTCEHVRFTGHESYGNGTHGAKISEWAKNCAVEGRFQTNSRIGVFIDNGSEDCSLLPGSVVRNNGQDSAAAATDRANVRIRDSLRSFIGADVRLLDSQASKTVSYGVYEDGTSDGTVISDDVVIDGFSTGAIKLAGSTSRAATPTKRRRLLTVSAGLKGENFDIGEAQGTFVPASGDLRTVLVPFAVGDSVAELYVSATIVGAALTKARLGIWNAAGTTLMASSGDLSTAFTAALTTAAKGEMRGGALSAVWDVPSDGVYRVGLLFVGTTAPSILRRTSGIANFASKTLATHRFTTQTGQADLPAILDLTDSKLSSTEFWLGWK